MNKASLGPIMLDVAADELSPEDRELICHPLVGGVILFTRNYHSPEQLSSLVADIRDLQPDVLIAVDYEGGRVQRFHQGLTRIPPMRQVGNLHDTAPDSALQLAHDCGWLIGAELGMFDIDLCFAPVLDLDGGVSEVIGDRAFHADPRVVIRLATAFVAGLNEAGMAATAKHFPGHGQVAPDSHKELPVDTRSYPQMAADLAPYQSLIQAGIPSVMMAHIQYPAVDELPASLSARWIQQHLRSELGFTGAVFSDDMSMGGAAVYGGYAERCVLALEAGCDMLPVCNNRQGLLEVLNCVAVHVNDMAQQRLSILRRKPAKVGNLAGNPRWQQARTHLEKLNISV